MIINSANIPEDEFVLDICIIGAGPAGISLAKELANTDKRIGLVESGDKVFDLETQLLYSPEKQPESFVDPTYSRMRFLGGSSNHWDNGTSPFDPYDFEAKPHMNSAGWPVSFGELSSYYGRAQDYCGVKSDGYELQKWLDRTQHPNPVEGSDILKTSISKSALSPVRFYEKYGPELEKKPNIQIFKNSNLVDLEFDQDTQQVKSITISPTPGKTHTISATTFILCLGGIENARMLLYFNRKYENTLGNQYDLVGRYFMDHPVVRPAVLYPNKNYNLSILTKPFDEQGRRVKGHLELTESTLRKHHISNLRIPLFEMSELDLSDGVESLNLFKDSFSQKELPDHFGQHLVNILTDIDMVSEAFYKKITGETFFDSSEEFAGYSLYTMIEQSPDYTNRIKLGETRDRFGINKILIDWSLSERDKESVWKAINLMALEVGRLNMGRVRVLKEFEERVFGDKLYFGHHHMGTTRMAHSEKEGVVDPDLKVFGTRNLYINSSSVFPSGSHLVPTLTILALSIRMAEHLKKEV